MLLSKAQKDQVTGFSRSGEDAGVSQKTFKKGTEANWNYCIKDIIFVISYVTVMNSCLINLFQPFAPWVIFSKCNLRYGPIFFRLIDALLIGKYSIILSLKIENSL